MMKWMIVRVLSVVVLNDERKNDESVVVSNQACEKHKTGSSEPTVNGTCISDSYVSINASDTYIA